MRSFIWSLVKVESGVVMTNLYECVEVRECFCWDCDEYEGCSGGMGKRRWEAQGCCPKFSTGRENDTASCSTNKQPVYFLSRPRVEATVVASWMVLARVDRILPSSMVNRPAIVQPPGVVTESLIAAG